MSSKDLDRQSTAIVRRLAPLKSLYEYRDQAPVILKIFSTIDHRNARLLAEIFVVGALVDILKAPPAAHVVNKNNTEIRFAGLYVTEQKFEAGPVI
jgi:hypothetical protein